MLRKTRINWEYMSELKIRWGVSKAAMLYRGWQLGVLTDEQVRSGFITLKRHGEAIEESEDRLMQVEEPEIIHDGLHVMKESLGIPLAAVAREMHIQPKLLNELLGRQNLQSPEDKIVNLFGNR